MVYLEKLVYYRSLPMRNQEVHYETPGYAQARVSQDGWTQRDGPRITPRPTPQSGNTCLGTTCALARISNAKVQREALGYEVERKSLFFAILIQERGWTYRASKAGPPSPACACSAISGGYGVASAPTRLRRLDRGRFGGA